MWRTSAVTSVVAGYLCSSIFAANQYSIRDLGIAGRTAIEVSVDSSGRVVLSIAPEEPPGLPPLAGEAFLIDGMDIANLGSLGGTRVVGTAINNRDQIVGQADLPDGNSVAFVFENGEMRDLNLAAFGATGGISSSINDQGDIVGQAYYGTVSRAFVLSKIGVFKPLPTLGGNHAYAADINEIGMVVGASRTESDDAYVAFLFHQGVITNLGTLGGPASFAAAINDGSVIVGGALTIDNSQHAALFAISGNPIDLAPNWPLSGAAEINNLGQIVGFVSHGPNEELQAAIFSLTELPVLLKDLIPVNSGWTSLYAASGINDRGQIVGVGIYNNQPGFRAFLMTPIPEPSSFAMFVICLLFCTGNFARKRIKPQQAGGD
jgi:probable HAF family extracellular repeat protein